jgi:hypothetical protein
MSTSMLELFRTLCAFAPARSDLSKAPWEQYTTWAIGQGLAPMAAYNLEYRLGNCGAPEWARDRLLSIYQGTANDNVMKLVNFKRAVDELEGRKLVLLGAASFVESLYPHVAFRPVIDFRLLLPGADLEGFANFLRGAQFVPDPEATDTTRPDKILTDTRSLIFLHTSLAPSPALDLELFSRVVPMKVYGPSMYRLQLEDALLVQVLLLVRAGFEVPMLEFVDLRELVLGAPSLGGVYSRPVDATVLKSRAAAWGLERGLYAALALTERLFPETSAQVSSLKPALNFAVRELLERLVVAPLAEVGRSHAFRGAEALRAALTGG